MKKLSILLVGLLLVAGLAVAQEFDGSVEVSGSSSVTFGVDLNTNYTGFDNAADSSISITLVADFGGTTGGDDGLYGEITLTDLAISADNTGLTVVDGAAQVEAKIVVSPVEIVIWGLPELAWGNATPIETDDWDTEFSMTSGDLGGITIVYPSDMVTVELYVVSAGDWLTNFEDDPLTPEPVDAENIYATGVDAELVFEPVTVNVGFGYGWLNAVADASYGATVKVALDLADVLNGVDLSVAADIAEGTPDLIY